jgi:molybdenum cofactor cytidylyltransferase
MGGIWAIILAAGESKRMGFPKMLLSFNGRSMIENVIGNIISSDIDHSLVVLGAHNGLLEELISKSPVKYCYNDNYKDGMLSSVKCGFRNLPADIEAVMVFQGDQPFIMPLVINKLIEEYKRCDKGIVIPLYEKKRGHPVLIDNKYREKIYKLDNSEGLRSLAHQFPEDVRYIDTDSPGILRDFDTYEEYLNEMNLKR